MRRTFSFDLRLTIGIAVPKFVRVRAYKRFLYGKWEKVRAHYRRYWEYL